MSIPPNEQPSQRLDQLLALYHDSELAPKQQEELLSLIDGNDEAARRFIDHTILETLLQEEIGPDSLAVMVDLLDEDEPSLNRLADDPGASRRSWSRRLFGGIAILVASVFVTFYVFRGNDSAFANSSIVVQAAIDTHGQNIERVYSVEVTRQNNISTELIRSAKVITQGDRFWVEVNDGRRPWAWGRTLNNSVWLTLGANRALVLAEHEIGRSLGLIADIYSLKTQSLLRDVDKHCEHHYSMPDALTHKIVAKPRNGRPRWLNQAILEIDVETKAIRRLTIDRKFGNDQRSTTITFTLVDSRNAIDSLFRPDGHLETGGAIFDGETQPDRRRAILKNRFGRIASGWLKRSE